MNEVYIVSAARTPIGSFGGKLAGFSATQLGSFAIKGALEKAGLDAKHVQEGLGQAPARQTAIGAGLGDNVPCTTINKVCASGMKAAMFAAQSIMIGAQDVIVAGGMESMSNVPYYIPKARYGYKYGNGELIDGLLHDGLWEVYNQFPMGNCADNTAKEMGITREQQDEFAINSYKKVAASTAAGHFKNEIIPVEIPQRKGDPIIMDEDEEFHNVIFEKIPSLRPVFSKEGTVTAANASTINDGASAMVLMSKKKAEELGIKPIARIIGFADAAQDPLWFTTAPSKVALANNIELGSDADKLNVFGGAVAMGHPLGASGCRIVTTLTSVLHQKGGSIGVAGICNGGGGASAMVIEKL